MDIKERILATLNWEEPDEVPLTVYDWMLPRGEKGRRLRESGVGLVLRPPAHRVEHREVEIISKEYWENGRKLIRKTIHTPVGDVWQTLEPDKSGYEPNFWIKEHFIKGPEDYPVMEFYVQDALYHDNDEYIREANRRIGGDGLVYVRVAKVPIQEMLYQMMGMERFSFDYYQQRELFDSLHHTMLKRYEELFAFAVESPVELLLFGDNITSDVVGEERYRNYCMPVYKRLTALAAGTGKKVGVHMDGRLARLNDAIGESEFDVVEALTPPPMGDISVREAREAWPDKALWINFTSSVHLAKSEVIEEHTKQLLEEAGSKRGFAIGVTEDAPFEDLERSLTVITNVLKEYSIG
jgi:hypothetical protein